MVEQGGGEAQWADLPPGLVEGIALHLSPDDRPDCRLVCRNWAAPFARTVRKMCPSYWSLTQAMALFPNVKILDLVRCTMSPNAVDFEGLAWFRNLQSLTMPKSCRKGRKYLDEASIKALGSLVSLKELDLSESCLECGLNGLSTLENLQKLTIRGCWWASSGHHGQVSIPTELGSLTHLDLSSSLLQVSDRDLEAISSMSWMRVLSLADCKWVMDPGIAVLSNLSNLKGLDLTRTGLTDQGVRAITQLMCLESLRLEGTLISDVGTSLLSGCVSLQKLDLSGCYMVTEEGISRLRGLKHLREIALQGVSHFSTRGVEYLCWFERLERVSFDMPQWIADEEVGLLAPANSLKSIAIHGCKGSCLLWMLSHPSLQEITLTDGRLGIDHVQYLSTLVALDTLRISKCEHLSLAAFEKLKCLKNLGNLSLDIAHGSFEKHFVIGSICPLVNLKSLSLSCEYILNETVSELWRLPHLEVLNLEDCVYLTDLGLEFLAMIHGLERLILKSASRHWGEENLPREMDITEKGLSWLTKLNRLQTFGLHGRHSIGAKSWACLNPAASLREIAIAVPPTQLYQDQVRKFIRAGMKVKFHAACIGTVN